MPLLPQIREQSALAIVDALSASIAVLDSTGEILFVNKAWRAFAAANAPDNPHLAEGQNYLAVCDAVVGEEAEEAASFARGVRAIIAGEQEEFLQEYACHSPYEQRWFIGRVTRFDSAGQRRIVVAHENITARKQAEETVHRREEQFRQLAENIHEAFWLLDLESRRTLYASSAHEAIWGFPSARLYEQPSSWLDVVHPEDQRRARQFAEQILRGEQIEFELRVLWPDRSVHWVKGRTFPIYDKHGVVHRIAGICEDVTQRKHLTEQLIERERLAAIGATAASFAHEVGNPLNSMSVTAQLLERRLAKSEGLADERVSRPLRSMKNEMERLSLLINEFRSLAQPYSLRLQPLSFADVVAEVLTQEAATHAAQRILVTQEFPSTLPPVQADHERLKELLLNLCRNAAEAMPQGGTLRVRAQQVGKHVRLEMSDTGIGVPSGMDIFAPFVTTKTQSTGLGLTIAWQIVYAHGGSLSYRNNQDQGATFTVLLPVAETPSSHS